jgi:hypothetical protein
MNKVLENKMRLVIKLNNSESLAFFGCFGLIFSLPNFYQIFLEKIFPIIIQNSTSNTNLFKFLYVVLLIFVTYESYCWIVQLAKNMQKIQHLKMDYNFYVAKVIFFGLLGITSAIILNKWLF